MSVPPNPPSPARRRPTPGLSRRALLLIALAFGAGLLLCLLFLLTRTQGADDRFFRPGAASSGANRGQVFEPLPTPDAAGGASGTQRGGDGDGPLRGAADDPAARDDAGGDAMLDPVLDPEPVPAPPAAPPPVATARPDAKAEPLRAPRPDYPHEAMRRGEQGTVLLQVQVDAEGRPVQVDVVQSSRSRLLDREAQRAVESWTFSPAIRGGRAVPSRVLVPVDFRR